MNTKLIVWIAIFFLIAVPVVIWTYELSSDTQESPRSTVSSEAHDLSDRFEWRFDKSLQANVAFLQGAERPHLVDQRKFQEEIVSSAEVELEFLSLRKIPGYKHYDQEFAERLGLGLMIKAPSEPVVVKPRTKRALLARRR